MNRIEKKEMMGNAATLFAGEVRELMPHIARKELCDMVDDYIYYQTDGASREETNAVIDGTCRSVVKTG